MTRIVLLGASFTNKGAEAMAVTAIAQLSELYPDCRITLATYSKPNTLTEGTHALPILTQRGAPARFELLYHPRLQKGVCLSLLQLICFRIPPLRRFWARRMWANDSLERLRQADLILDLSGYAMTDQRSFGRQAVYAFEVLAASWQKTPIALMTQAFGPFERRLSRWIAAAALRNASLILARGDSSLRYVRQLGLPPHLPVSVCADMAFLLPPSPPEEADRLLGAPEAERPFFGIVPNIRAFYQAAADGENRYLRLLARLCDVAYAEWGCQPVLICHERSVRQPNDAWLIDEIRARVERPAACRVISAEHSAMELKAVIGRLAFVTASRFHSVVAAISMATPFVVIGWAHKYHELLAQIGMTEAAVDAKQFDEDAVMRLIETQWNAHANTRRHLEAARAGLCQSARAAFERLAELWPPSAPLKP